MEFGDGEGGRVEPGLGSPDIKGKLRGAELGLFHFYSRSDNSLGDCNNGIAPRA